MSVNSFISDEAREYENGNYYLYSNAYKQGLYRVKDVNENSHIIDDLKNKLLSGDIPYSLDKVYVKESKVHGLGVFAKHNIKKGDLITFYPGDIVVYEIIKINKDERQTLHFPSSRFVEVHGQIDEKQEIIKKYTKESNYKFKIDEKYEIIGDPMFFKDPSYLGHMINDAAKCPVAERGHKFYLNVSFQKSNCFFHTAKGGLSVMVIALKDITKNEELFVTYGVEYWKDWHKNNKT